VKGPGVRYGLRCQRIARINGVEKTGVVTVVESVVTLGKNQPKMGTNGNNRKDCRGRFNCLETLDLIGSSGRTRTYNPSVNSRMLYH
jgi:hypothetical protein